MQLDTTPKAVDNASGSRAQMLSFSVLVTLGVVALMLALLDIWKNCPGFQWMILAAFTVLTGRFTVRIPGVKSRTSVADALIFTNILMFGPGPGIITAALDGLLCSIRMETRQRRRQYVAYNMAGMSFSALIAGHAALLAGGGRAAMGNAPVALGDLLIPASAMAVAYYAINTSTVALMAALDLGRPVWRIWRERFLWTGLTYFAAASIAAIIAVTIQDISLSALAITLPILLVSYFTYRTYLEKEEESAHRAQLDRLHLQTVEALASAIDAREEGTLGHARRVQIYAAGLARALRIRDESEIRGIEAAALLLDIGNLAVPEHILNNPGKLTKAEFQKIMVHPAVGSNILSSIDFPYPLAALVRHHHERWDGAGYPDHLAGSSIPLGARILAVADCYVALTVKRPYQRAHSHDEAMRILKTKSGKAYDPEVVLAFVEIVERLNLEILEMEQKKCGQAGSPSAEASEGPFQDLRSAGNSSALKDISGTQREVSKLQELVQALNTALCLRETLGVITHKTAQLIPFSSAVIYLLQDDGQRLAAVHAMGADAEILEHYCIDYGTRISGWVAAQREPVLNADARNDLAPIQSKLTARQEVVLAHPLTTENRCIGVLSLYSPKYAPFRDDDLRVVAAIAQPSAAAIRNALRFEEAQENALTDSLTSLPNIRYLRQYWEQAAARARRQGQPLSVLVMDLDDFKKINDCHGHQNGDRVLIEISSVLARMMRGEDLIARQGGDEFIALVELAGADEAERLVARIKEAIDAVRVLIVPGTWVGVGISIGYATFPDEGEVLDDLIRTADLRMYEDKRSRDGDTAGMKACGEQHVTPRRESA